MLLIFRPFRIGHKVQVGGHLGTVKELTLFWTELVTDDNVQIHCAEWRCLRSGPAKFQHLSGASAWRRSTLPDRSGEQHRTGNGKGAGIVETDPRVLGDPAPSVLLDHGANAMPASKSSSASLPRTRRPREAI
jgi:hypothetical protein